MCGFQGAFYSYWPIWDGADDGSWIYSSKKQTQITFLNNFTTRKFLFTLKNRNFETGKNAENLKNRITSKNIKKLKSFTMQQISKFRQFRIQYQIDKKFKWKIFPNILILYLINLF